MLSVHTDTHRILCTTKAQDWSSMLYKVPACKAQWDIIHFFVLAACSLCALFCAYFGIGVAILLSHVKLSCKSSRFDRSVASRSSFPFSSYLVYYKNYTIDFYALRFVLQNQKYIFRHVKDNRHWRQSNLQDNLDRNHAESRVWQKKVSAVYPMKSATRLTQPLVSTWGLCPGHVLRASWGFYCAEGYWVLSPWTQLSMQVRNFHLHPKTLHLHTWRRCASVSLFAVNSYSTLLVPWYLASMFCTAPLANARAEACKLHTQ